MDSIAKGEWAKFSKSQRLVAVFTECDVVHPSFYDVDGMNFENESWAHETDTVYIGAENAKGNPGTIDPRQSLLIADLGPDRPIALDYRFVDEPSVVYLSDDETQGWVTVASCVDSLLSMITPNKDRRL